jgi:hypothetical protein
VVPRADLDDLEKRKFLTLPGLELRPSVVQPVASRYTDSAIPDLMICRKKSIYSRQQRNGYRKSVQNSYRE